MIPKLSCLILILITICFINSTFAYCVSDWIREESGDGAYIAMGLSRTEWRIDVFDRSNSWLWSPNDKVLICNNCINDYIIHEDDNTIVLATRVY